jgi:penicillin-binding protein 2
VAQAFGFDKKTGIDLPIEVAGNVPTRRYYDKLHRQGTLDAGTDDQQLHRPGEYLATVLHVARVAAAVANGGWLVTPHFVESIEATRTLEHPRTKIEGLDDGNLAFLRRRHAGRGARHRAAPLLGPRLPNIQVAGKTGTAQNPHGDDHSVVHVLSPPPTIRGLRWRSSSKMPGHGSEIAAPMARDFIREYIPPRPAPAWVPPVQAVPSLVKKAGRDGGAWGR